MRVLLRLLVQTCLLLQNQDGRLEQEQHEENELSWRLELLGGSLIELQGFWESHRGISLRGGPRGSGQAQL